MRRPARWGPTWGGTSPKRPSKRDRRRWAIVWGKFARRNRAAFTTIASVFLVMLAATAVSTWQAVRANFEAARASAERDRAIASEEKAQVEGDRAREAEGNLIETLEWLDAYLIRSVDPAESQDRDLPLRIAVERAAEALKPGRQSPLVEASIRVRLGEAFISLSNREMAGRAVAAGGADLAKGAGRTSP